MFLQEINQHMQRFGSKEEADQLKSCVEKMRGFEVKEVRPLTMAERITFDFNGRVICDEWSHYPVFSDCTWGLFYINNNEATFDESIIMAARNLVTEIEEATGRIYTVGGLANGMRNKSVQIAPALVAISKPGLQNPGTATWLEEMSGTLNLVGPATDFDHETGEIIEVVPKEDEVVHYKRRNTKVPEPVKRIPRRQYKTKKRLAAEAKAKPKRAYHKKAKIGRPRKVK